ncbi:MAG: lamin tail domain-containing protein [Prolixibacteraceae bacterium]
MKILFSFLYTIGLLMVLVPGKLHAQIVINEFMASNTGVIVDPDNSESSDWIELYNSGSSTVSLKGYYLSDNLSIPDKWKISSDIQLKSHEYVIVWTDGTNVGMHANFKLSASGEELVLSSPSLVVLDSLIFGLQEPNISYGRKTDGNKVWAYFTVPTPGKTNGGETFTGIVRSYPDFSLEGGIFHETISIDIKSLYAGDVRYTLNGAEPTEQSPLASTSINIAKNTVVRARIFKTGQVMGPIATNSYFIDLNKELSDLPIVSISSDPENFWDPVKGIYVVHDTKPDWEIPVNIELFESDGRDLAAFNLPAGVKSTGLYSWQLPEKMLGVSFRKEYGAGKLDYQLIFDKARKVFDTFSIRASGSDWAGTLFADGLSQTAAVYNTNLDISGFRPCVVYINGEYMGIHNLREKVDEDYIVGNYGLEAGTFDMIEEVDGGINVEAGDDIANTYFTSLISKDLTNQSNYDAVANEMEIEEFTEMVCAEVYTGNSSIGHNLMKWKPKDSGKWRWILMDFDRGFSGVNNELISFYLKESGWPFGDLMDNADYKKYFGLKLADLLFTTFNSDRMLAEIDDHANLIEADIPNHVKRWEGTSGTGNYSSIKAISSVNAWLSKVESFKTFAQARPDVILDDLTNYGFQSPVALSITTTPEKAGLLTLNGMKIPVDDCNGAYPKGEELKLSAEAKAGYQFMGWQTNGDSLCIDKEENWKYFDGGTDLGVAWRRLDFSDAAWKSGQAELGYGDNDENTTISYGSSSSNKYICSYFRKNFTIKNKANITGLSLQLKCDDGAVVYLNGTEILRYNMPTGTISSSTEAIDGIGGSDESLFHSYSLGAENLITGTNLIAVEIHQNSSSSSDVSFDLVLSAQQLGTGQFLSTNKDLTIRTDSDLNVTAVFESNGKCQLPELITDELILNEACSPYVCSSDVQITSTGKLNIQPGVEIWMSDGASIYSEGPILAQGTESKPITFKGNPERSDKIWGLISISNASDTSRFTHVIIEDASQGKQPREVAALTAYNTAIKIDHIHFDYILANPIASRFCDISVTNSLLYSNVIGDLINVTRGKGYIANCEFIGNYLPDNDAIDFNGGSNALVKDCIIRDFFGINNDAIDLGEKASNIVLEGLFVHDITDKGVSVGQWSSATIRNSLFTNCNMGVGVKDSSNVKIDHCTFYGVGLPIHTYEKIAGRAGGNVVVTNSILSNSYEASYLCDEFSSIDISFSASDNDRLPDNRKNIFVNPLFTNPTYFDFSLQANSPCINAGSIGNIGSGLSDTGIEPEILISDIAYFTEAGAEDLEFVGLYNPGNSSVDVSRYVFQSGINFTFPDGANIRSKEKIYVTSNSASSFWDNKGAKVYQWESGRLDDKGEDIQLTNEVLTMIDEVDYNNKAPWPLPAHAFQAISLSQFDVDNHFGENWVLKTYDDIVSIEDLSLETEQFEMYPNPATGIVFIQGNDIEGKMLTIYNLSGVTVQSQMLNASQSNFSITNLTPGMYLVRCGQITQRLMVLK